MELLVYLAQVCLYGFIMWGIYWLAWRGKPWHRASRIHLLAGAVLPLFLPLVHLRLRIPIPHALHSEALPSVLAETLSGTAPKPAFPASELVIFAYALGSLIVALFYGAAYLRLLGSLRRGRSARVDGYSIVTHTGTGPGTIGTRIFFPGDVTDPAILRHEIAHIQAGHRFDAMLIQVLRIFFWSSPALWLIGRELKTVHEFEADARVLQATDPATYAALLLSQAFGIPQFHIAHLFFHHPLKRRILMMQKTGRPRTAKTTIFLSLLLTAALCGAALFAQAGGEKTSPKADKELPKPDSTAPKPVEAKRLLDGRWIYSPGQLQSWPRNGKGEGC